MQWRREHIEKRHLSGWGGPGRKMTETADTSSTVESLRDGCTTRQASSRGLAASISHAEPSTDDSTSFTPLSPAIGVDHEVITRVRLALQAMHDAAQRYALEKISLSPIPRTSSDDGFGGVDHDLIYRAQSSLKQLENQTALAHRHAELHSEVAIDDALVRRAQGSLQGLCTEAGRLDEALRIELGSALGEQRLSSNHQNDLEGVRQYPEQLAAALSPSRVAAREVCADMVELCDLLKQRIPEPRQSWWTKVVPRCTVGRTTRCQRRLYVPFSLAVFAMLPLLLIPRATQLGACFPAICTEPFSRLQLGECFWDLVSRSSPECNSVLLPDDREFSSTGPQSRWQQHARKGRQHEKERDGPNPLHQLASRIPQLRFFQWAGRVHSA